MSGMTRSSRTASTSAAACSAREPLRAGGGGAYAVARRLEVLAERGAGRSVVLDDEDGCVAIHGAPFSSPVPPTVRRRPRDDDRPPDLVAQRLQLAASSPAPGSELAAAPAREAEAWPRSRSVAFSRRLSAPSTMCRSRGSSRAMASETCRDTSVPSALRYPAPRPPARRRTAVELEVVDVPSATGASRRRSSALNPLTDSDHVGGRDLELLRDEGRRSDSLRRGRRCVRARRPGGFV